MCRGTPIPNGIMSKDNYQRLTVITAPFIRSFIRSERTKFIICSPKFLITIWKKQQRTFAKRFPILCESIRNRSSPRSSACANCSTRSAASTRTRAFLLINNRKTTERVEKSLYLFVFLFQKKIPQGNESFPRQLRAVDVNRRRTKNILKKSESRQFRSELVRPPT